MKMEDRSWMYDGAEGDPLLYFKYGVLVRIARTMYCGPRLKLFVSTCWRRVSLITAQSGPNTVKWERMRKATAPNREGRKLVMMILLMCSTIVRVVNALMWKNCCTTLSVMIY
jgi:hypothetical protein